MPKRQYLSLRVLGVLACGLFAASCGDSPTEPPFAISLRGDEQHRAVIVKGLDQTEYRCGYLEVKAAASRGGRGTFASWEGAILRLRALDSNALLATASYSAEKLAEWLGTARIAAGETQGMYWNVWGTEPFRATVEYLYRVEGRGAVQSVELSFTCANLPSRITSTFLLFSSGLDDFIGQGRTEHYTLADGSWRVQAESSPSGFGVSHIRVNFEEWELDLAAPEGKMLAPGLYEEAEEWPFQAATKPGISFAGYGRACRTLTGEFTIHELVLGADLAVERLHATFKQHCEGASRALTGEIGIVANPWR